jgi:hypothetical protein
MLLVLNSLNESIIEIGLIVCRSRATARIHVAQPSRRWSIIITVHTSSSSRNRTVAAMPR